MQYRKLIRLRGYDYSNTGWYFVTVCAEYGEHRFGFISDGKMFVNNAGEMIERWFREIHHAFPHVQCDEYVVMPNHFHCILHITEQGNKGIVEIMDWFKTMSTNEYIRGVKQGIFPRFNKRIWQARYWDHIVRSQHELDLIRLYIKNNPLSWHMDKLNSDENSTREPRAMYGEQDWMV